MQPLKKSIEAVKAGFHALMPTCRQAARIQSEALDHPLSPVKKFGLWLHLLICKWCRRYGKQIRFLNRGAHLHSDELVEACPQKLSDQARARIKRRLQTDRE